MPKFLDTPGGEYDTHANRYGVRNSNTVSLPEWNDFLDSVNHKDIRGLDDPELVRIVRLRLVTTWDFPFWDISYCYGQLRNGRFVRVSLGTNQLHKEYGGYRAHLIEIFKKARRYAKGMEVFKEGVISTMC